MVGALLQTHFCACCCGRCCYCCGCSTCCSEDNVQCVAFFSPRRPLFPFLPFSPCDPFCLARFPRGSRGCSPHSSTASRRPQVWAVVHTDPPGVSPPCHVSCRHIIFLRALNSFPSLLRRTSLALSSLLLLHALPGPRLLFLLFAPPDLFLLSRDFLARPEHSLLCLAPLEPALHSLALPEPFSVLAPPALSSLLAPPALCSLPLAPPALCSLPLVTSVQPVTSFSTSASHPFSFLIPSPFLTDSLSSRPFFSSSLSPISPLSLSLLSC